MESPGAAAQTLAMAALLAGGVLVSRRSRTGAGVLRAGAVGSGVFSVATTAMAMYSLPSFWSSWSTPGAAAFQAIQVAEALWVPVLMVLLTLPPLGRRML